MAWLCLCEQEHTLNCLISFYILNQSQTTGVMLSGTDPLENNSVLALPTMLVVLKMAYLFLYCGRHTVKANADRFRQCLQTSRQPRKQRCHGHHRLSSPY